MSETRNRAGFPPRGSCDCHVHVIGPRVEFPLDRRRSYTPLDASGADLQAMMRLLGTERAVVVQPSVYGTDNACTLHAVEKLGNAGRAVAVVADDCCGSELDRLHRAGVRGLRLNLMSLGTPDAQTIAGKLTAAARQCARNGWHVQLFAPAAHLPALAATIRPLPVDVVFDHFALLRPDSFDQAAFQTVTSLLSEGRAWIKLSGNYRVAEDPFDGRLADLARAVADANPERVLWASDWPHTPKHSRSGEADDHEVAYRTIDTGSLLTEFSQWFTPDRMARILVHNPARLYDFPSA